MAETKASLSIDGKEIAELPILKGTAGTDVIDIRALGGHGYFTYDPGFLATAYPADLANRLQSPST